MYTQDLNKYMPNVWKPFLQYVSQDKGCEYVD